MQWRLDDCWLNVNPGGKGLKLESSAKETQDDDKAN